MGNAGPGSALDLVDAAGVNQATKANKTRCKRKANLEVADPGLTHTVSAESLDSEGECWAPGTEYKVTEQRLMLWEAPCGRRIDFVDVGGEVLLLKTVEESGMTWGLVDPLPSTKKRAAWVLLMVTDAEAAVDRLGAVVPSVQGVQLQKQGSGWEVGESYTAVQGIIVRAGPDLSSEKLCTLAEEEIAEILEFGIDEGTEGRPRLRAKILSWRTHTAGWISPRSKDGDRLLAKRTIEKLDLTGRTTQIYHRSFGGA